MDERKYFLKLQGDLDARRCGCGETCPDCLANADDYSASFIAKYKEELRNRSHAGLPDEELSAILRHEGLPGIRFMNDSEFFPLLREFMDTIYDFKKQGNDFEKFRHADFFERAELLAIHYFPERMYELTEDYENKRRNAK